MIQRINRGSFGSSMRTSSKSQPSDQGENVHQKAPETKSDDVRDSIGFSHFTSEDMTPEGKIPIIISGNDKNSLEDLKSKIAKDFSIDQAKFKDELPLVDGLKVDVDPYNFKRLMKSLPPETTVALDSKIKYPIPTKISQPIPDPEKEERPALDIANSTLGVNRLWEQGFTGKGIGICVIDSGLYPHKDFDGRLKAFVDMNEGKKKPYDPLGHGTHVAGVAAGSGAESAGKYKGVAPDADLVGIRITSVAEAIKGIQWAIENKDKYNIKVLNMSLGDFPLKSYKDDPWSQAAAKAWDAGLVVVVAAGNEGPGEGTISTPGIQPKVITVGAIDDRNTPEREDDVMAHFSSRGPTSPDGLEKPDIVAPGVDIYGPLSPGSTLDTSDMPHYENKYISMSGSSMATPLVSGLSALLLQANPNLTNEDIKKILMNTAEKYIPSVKPTDEGAGLIDPLESLQVALGKKKPNVVTAKKEENLPMLISDNVVKSNPKKA